MPAAAAMAQGLALAAGAAPFAPDDPKFQPDAGDAHQGQWYLQQARFPAAWHQGATGRSVIIGVVDNTFGLPHPDVEPARVRELDWDFAEEDAEVSGLAEFGGSHGLMVAGVLAARGGNGMGICGAAPLAEIAWIRSGGPAKLEAMVRHDPDPQRRIRVKNYSIGSAAAFESKTGPQTAVRRAFRETAEQGMIHVVAAGNEGGWAGGDCGKSGLCSSPHVLVVAACDRERRTVAWSGYGGPVLACAPSAESGKDNGILTVADASCSPIPGDEGWTISFGGTSAAAPQVAGLMAMGVEVLPGLDARLAKHLLSKACARPADEPEDHWLNAGGTWHSPKSGFGVIDAGRFIELARQNPELTPPTLEPDRRRDDELGMQQVAVGADIPNDDRAGLTRTFSVIGGQPLEEVEIHVEIKHRDRGQLSAWIQSPSGTRRNLFAAHPVDHKADIGWIFVTHSFWGEDPKGRWTLTVTDDAPGEAGEWVAFGWRVRMGKLKEL